MRNIQLNLERLHGKGYTFEDLFQSESFGWQGDWEGRALLAFLNHYEINQKTVPYLHQFFDALPERTNRHFYFGAEFDGITVNEQQFSGHNWYLRGLLKYAKLFNSELALKIAKSTVENLYLPALEWYDHYPLENRGASGGVFGNTTNEQNGWKLSSDIGCAFMCVDGLAHYYQATKDDRVKTFLDKLIDLFVTIDLIKYKFQTHTTLTCLRGIYVLYQTTQEEKYLQIVKEKFAFYVANGMTFTYENFNWFGRKDTWTEPCAVVDSFILAVELYNLTKESNYKTLARRIWFNGLQFCQRENGGAGPNTCVYESQNVLKISMYEAAGCCTMRYAEGLLFYAQNQSLFEWDSTASVVIDSFGRSFIDDVLLVKYKEKMIPIFSCNTIPKEDALEMELIVF
ncbi:MAG: hypothetical protein E7381_02170 [Clostridiales bacterium]|nr:hypothetical protein [Clostridiales bacterium]